MPAKASVKLLLVVPARVNVCTSAVVEVTLTGRLRAAIAGRSFKASCTIWALGGVVPEVGVWRYVWSWTLVGLPVTCVVAATPPNDRPKGPPPDWLMR